MNAREYPYATHLDIKYGALNVVDVPALVAACTDRWFNQTLCRVNASVVQLGVVQGEYHWHRHAADDEFFFVLEGRLMVDVEAKTFALGERQGLVVPRGGETPHPRAREGRHPDGRERRDRPDR